MTCSTVKKLTEPLDKPEREFQRLRRAALRQHQNESLAIAERNLFDNDASSCNDNRTKIVAPLKALREHSLPNSAGFQNPIILPAEQTGRIVNSRDIWLIQGTCMFHGLKSENPLQPYPSTLKITDDNIQLRGHKDESRLKQPFLSTSPSNENLKKAIYEQRCPPVQITTWDQLVTRFLDYFFPVGHTLFLQDMIIRFKQGTNEPIKSAWIHF
ncbi:hypothetical protein Tco_0439134 [Tanacetum coccineum]